MRITNTPWKTAMSRQITLSALIAHQTIKPDVTAHPWGKSVLTALETLRLLTRSKFASPQTTFNYVLGRAFVNFPTSVMNLTWTLCEGSWYIPMILIFLLSLLIWLMSFTWTYLITSVLALDTSINFTEKSFLQEIETPLWPAHFSVRTILNDL